MASRVAMSMDVLVLNARSRQALVTVRSLGLRGLAVAAADSSPDVPAFHSRWCQRHVVSAPVGEANCTVEALEKLLDDTGARVVIAGHDGTIAFLRAHRARLEMRTRLALSPEAAMAIATNKERTLAIAQRLGIAVPRGMLLQNASQVPTAVAEIGLPAVVKPTESWLSDGRTGTWVGPQLVTTLEETRRAVRALEQLGGVALVQTFLSGRREAVSLFYANDRVHARFAQWAKRMNPPLGGESVLRQSIAVPPDLGGQAEALVREIGLEGYSEVEFRRSAAGVPHLMEINPRLSASVEIAVRSGVDFPHLLYQWAMGTPIDYVASYRAGRWMRYLQGDVMTTLRALEQRGRPGVPSPLRAVWDFVASCFVPMRYDYVDLSDPGPAVKAMGDLARDLLNGGGRVLRKSAGTFLKRFAWGMRAT